MSKDAVISEILSMSVDEQFEVLRTLQMHLADHFILDEEKDREIERRMERIEREGFKGRPWKQISKELEATSPDNRNARHRSR
jgi:hypothetical protein